jgi:stage II sporulation protein D
MRPRIAVAVTTLALTASFAPHVASALDEVGGHDRRAAAAQPRVAVNQSYPVPGSGRYTVRGHGYGHGHGMSQWGAQGAALAGRSYRQILDFYYPGTAVATAAKKVRVLITGDTTTDVVVLARPGLIVRDRGAATTYPLPSGPSRWRINPGAGNADVVQQWTGSVWKDWRTLEGGGEFRAPGPIALVKPSGTVRYSGALRAVAPTTGSTSRDTVNVVTLDSYVKGVVPYEVYTSWRPAALQAQAVAARTYAAYERADHADRYYQICDTSSCQVYGGVDKEVQSTNDAVDATSREILTYDGGPAFTQFSASSGGWTSAGGFPYLPEKADPWDATASNTSHSWSTTITAAAIRNHFPAIGALVRIRVTQRTGHGDWQGRVLSMTLVGKRGSRTMSGDTFRSTFGLRSNWFTFG